MKNNVLVKYVIPFGVMYFAFTYLGTLGGLGSALLYLAFMAYLNRALIYQNRAGKRYRSGDLEGALTDLESAVRYAPNDHRIRGSLAYLLLKLGHTDNAAKQMESALNLCKTQADRNNLKVTQALILWKQENLDEAIKLLEELMKEFMNTNVYGTLGSLYIEQGNPDKALAFNLEAFDYNNTNPVILDNLGQSYYLKQDYDKALEIYTQLIKMKPAFPEAYYNYGRVLEQFQNYEHALYMCRTARTFKFWNTSTVTVQEVDGAIKELEEKYEAQERDQKRIEPVEEPGQYAQDADE